MSATRNVVDAANLIEIPVVLISTDVHRSGGGARGQDAGFGHFVAALVESLRELSGRDVALTRLRVELEQARG